MTTEYTEYTEKFLNFLFLCLLCFLWLKLLIQPLGKGSNEA
jgi:hypothetical protein